MTQIYLDNNATTRLDPIVAEVMYRNAAVRLSNPASQHQSGRKARQLLEAAREGVAGHLGCRVVGMATDSIILTSGGTEANNLAIFGLRSSGDKGSFQKYAQTASCHGSVVVSMIEHPSVLAAAGTLEKFGSSKVQYCPVDDNGVFDLIAFREMIDRHDRALEAGDNSSSINLVSMMLANNETGVMQPVQSIVDLCRPRGILVHTDAVQVLGKQPLSFQSLGVDAMTVTAHKIHGPPGIGALVVRAGVKVEPQIFGGFQQLGVRPGTECVALAMGFEKATSIATEKVYERSSHMRKVREVFESRLMSSSERPLIIGSAVDRLPHTTSIAFKGCDRQALQMALDFAGVECSTGSACASGSGQPSHVLKAMGLDESIIQAAVRFSLSHETTLEEAERAAKIIGSVVETFASKQKKLKTGSN